MTRRNCCAGPGSKVDAPEAAAGPGWEIQEVSRVGAQSVTSKSKLLARECRECAAEACGAVRGKIVGGRGCWTSTAGWTPPAAEGKAPPACFAVSRSGARACACECAMSCRVGVQCSAAESTREEHGSHALVHTFSLIPHARAARRGRHHHAVVFLHQAREKRKEKRRGGGRSYGYESPCAARRSSWPSPTRCGGSPAPARPHCGRSPRCTRR